MMSGGKINQDMRLKLFPGILLVVLNFHFTQAQQPDRILVTDFGAMPDSKSDATAAVQRALAACQYKEHAVLVFPKGRYDLFPDSAVKKEYFISNTSSESECPSKIRTIGLWLHKLKHLRIEGEGSLLVYHGKMITFALDSCEDIAIRDLEVDFERPTISECMITRSSGTDVEVQVHPDSWYRLDSGRLHWYGEGWVAENYFCIRVDTTAHTLYYANDEYGRLMASLITETGPRRLNFHGSFDPSRYPAGDVLTVRDPIRDEVGAFILFSKNITLENVAMHYMHGLGIVSQYSENITLHKVVIAPRKGSGRWIAGFADGMHFSGCKGRICIDSCRFDGLHDDAINVHGTHLKITQLPSARQLVVRFMHPQTYGFTAFLPNDSIAFVYPPTLAITAYGKIESALRLSDREILLTLQQDIPSGVRAEDVVENISWTPELTIRKCRFTGTNTRGVLVTTRRKVVIEDNEFLRLGMQAILIADDALSWYESGQVRDVLIRHNIFRECGHNALPENYPIAIVPENHEETTRAVHHNIRIENNRFYIYSTAVLAARSVDGLSFTGNIVRYIPRHPAPARVPVFKLTTCTHVVFRNNTIDPHIHFSKIF